MVIGRNYSRLGVVGLSQIRSSGRIRLRGLRQERLLPAQAIVQSQPPAEFPRILRVQVDVRSPELMNWIPERLLQARVVLGSRPVVGEGCRAIRQGPGGL